MIILQSPVPQFRGQPLSMHFPCGDLHTSERAGGGRSDRFRAALAEAYGLWIRIPKDRVGKSGKAEVPHIVLTDCLNSDAPAKAEAQDKRFQIELSALHQLLFYTA